MEIRGFTLCYAKQKAKQNRNEEKQLQQHLCALQSRQLTKVHPKQISQIFTRRKSN